MSSTPSKNTALTSSNIDVLEDSLMQISPQLLSILLCDRTTQKNIIWATNDYKSLGDGYAFEDEILPELVTGEHGNVIMPRVMKTRQQQTGRSKDRAEVFTPSWICNVQNNLVDDAWFGQTEVFNHEINEGDTHTWESFEIPRIPSNIEWSDYVKSTRLEIACGEAPYLISRFDATTGEYIPVGKRIGILDRKMWIVNNFTPCIEDGMSPSQKKYIHKIWMRNAYRAFQSTYGFEWQGDSLLIARESLLISLIEYYQAKWKTDKLPNLNCILKVAEIISWNIWQMDGLNYGIPGKQPKEKFPDKNSLKFDFDENILPDERLCRIKEWKGYEPLVGNVVIFKSLINDNKK